MNDVLVLNSSKGRLLVSRVYLTHYAPCWSPAIRHVFFPDQTKTVFLSTIGLESVDYSRSNDYPTCIIQRIILPHFKADTKYAKFFYHSYLSCVVQEVTHIVGTVQHRYSIEIWIVSDDSRTETNPFYHVRVLQQDHVLGPLYGTEKTPVELEEMESWWHRLNTLQR